MVGDEWRGLEQDFRRYLAANNSSLETVRTYGDHARYFYQWADGRGLHPFAADAADVRLHVDGLLRSHSRNYTHIRVLALRALFKYVIVLGRRQDNPGYTVWVSKDEDTLPKRPIEVDEMDRLVAACGKGRPREREVLAARDRAILLTLYGCGLRVGELVSMTVERIDFERDLLWVKGKGGHWREVAPGPAVREALAAYLGGRRTGLVWLTLDGRPLRKNRAQRVIYEICVKAGVVAFFPHRMRATWISDMLEDGVPIDDVAVLAGHKSTKQTAHYARAKQGQRALKAHRANNRANRYALSVAPAL